ncbi:L,D-transpeptidase family protein [Nocardioides sp. BP30]|uniref:L,D-transpeptidase family protein n=1 Tax=Nocardioides sp. BP30 TaxID=3036374 RepID=UPI0024691C6C|nr:L,D-transpeptidase family protein [Nocardioides sp. BP30]WGL53763.1 L,D-transpeptidase family protein [Nocardioides sp. BP30]
MDRLGAALRPGLVAVLAAILLAGDLLAPGADAATSLPMSARAPGVVAAAPGARVALPDPRVATFADQVPADTTQVVRTIPSHRWCKAVFCSLTQAWRKTRAGEWRLVRQFRSTIGSRGWGKTKEGDDRSPVGVYRITVTFSTGARPGPMPWRRRKPTSVLSMSHGATYNTWLEIPGRTAGDRPSMRWGWVVDYNHPRLTPGKGPRPVPGKGGAIFYHTSLPGRRYAPTEGCTQVGNPRSMHWLVRWLRPQADPRVVQDL